MIPDRATQRTLSGILLALVFLFPLLAIANEPPTSPGFWRLEYYGRFVQAGDGEHAWLINAGRLERIDRLGRNKPIEDAGISVSVFAPVLGTPTGWAISVQGTQQDFVRVSFVEGSGHVFVVANTPCPGLTTQRATSDFLWIACFPGEERYTPSLTPGSLVRIGRDGKIAKISATSDLLEASIVTFDGGRGAWLISRFQGLVLRFRPDRAHERDRATTFQFGSAFNPYDAGHSSDGRFLWITDGDVAGDSSPVPRPVKSNLFLLDADADDDRWKTPVSQYACQAVVHDGAIAWTRFDRVTTDRRAVPLPHDAGRLLFGSEDGRSAWMIKGNDLELLTLASDGKWKSKATAGKVGRATPVWPAGPFGAWTLCAGHACLLNTEGEATYRGSAPAGVFFGFKASADGQHALFFDLRRDAPVRLHLLGAGAPGDLGEAPYDPSKTELLARSAQVVFAQDGMHFWLVPRGSETEGKVYLYGTGSDATAKVSLRGMALAPTENTTLRIDPAELGGDVAVSWPDGGPPPLRLRIEVSLRNGDAVVAKASVPDGHFGSLQWSPNARQDGPFAVDVQLYDELSHRITIRAGTVRFVPPLLNRPWVRSLLLYIALLLLAALAVAGFRPSLPRVTRMLPSLVTAAGATAATIGPRLTSALDFNVDTTVLLGLLGATLVGCLIAGVVSPSAFRLIVEGEPFRALAPLLLSVPHVRRRLYLDYLFKQVDGPLRRARETASDENYVVVSARVVDSVTTDAGPTGVLDDPAARVCALLTQGDVDERWDVLLESPGGRGKSALVREVMRRASYEFRSRSDAPLPLWINVTDGKKSLFELVIATLQQYLIAPATIMARMRAGDFFVVVDGLTESGLSPEAVQAFVELDSIAIRGLFACRPNEHYRAAVKVARHFAVIEPLGLDDTALHRFVDAYRGSAPDLSNELKTICRGPDGSYLPILVRLALLVGGNDLASVAEVYQQTFLKLFRGPDRAEEGEAREALDEAAQLCLTTFWPEGYRGIAFASADAARAGLLHRLLNAGVLVSSGADSRTGSKPREVRFFHDSMQSYLTARGLFANGAWKELARAAGAPQFQGGISKNSGPRASEVFQMCLEVFAPVEKVVAVLRADLDSWGRERSGDLTRNAVLGRLPDEVRSAVENELERELGGGAVLRQATLHLDCGPTVERVRGLGDLYGAIAPLVWPLLIAEPSPPTTQPRQD